MDHERVEAWVHHCARGDHDLHPLEGATFGKEPGCFVDQRTGDLGPYIRWLVALRLLDRLRRTRGIGLRGNAPKGDPAQRVQEALMECSDGVDLRAAFRGAFKVEKRAWVKPGRYLEGLPLFRSILSGLRQEGLREVAWHDFHSVRNVRDGGSVEPQSLVRFEQWLRHGVHPAFDDTSDLACEHLLLPEGGALRRARQVQGILDALDPSKDVPPIVNIHSRGGWIGLRALATHLLRSLQRNRWIDAQGVRRALIYVTLSRLGGNKAAATPAAVVERLRRAFGMPVQPTENANTFDLHRDLLPLRRALTIHPTLIVFDGIDNAIGPLSAVVELLQHQHWGEFIRVLVQPDFDTLSKSNSTYRSRFVVLSGYRVNDVAPWSSLMQPLLGPDDSVASRSLLDRPQVYEQQLAATCQALRTQPSSTGMHQLYPVEAEKLDLIFKDPRLLAAPTEVELALAAMLDLHELRTLLGETGGRAATRPGLRRQMLGHWIAARRRDRQTMHALVALQFVAASMNGLRLPTMRRCLARWLELARPQLGDEAAARLRAGFDRCVGGAEDAGSRCWLVKMFPYVLDQTVDEEVEALDHGQRAFELDLHSKGQNEPATDPDDRTLLDVRQQEMRELLLAEMIAPTVLPAAAGDLSAISAERMWQLVNVVLAQEALTQATVQLRSLHSRDLGNVHVLRRLVQAVMHGLMCRDWDGRGSVDAAAIWTQVRSALPPDPKGRFRYLYTLLYRNCIDNAPNWTLGRGFARSELRYQLLRLFACPRAVLDWQSADDLRNQGSPSSCIEGRRIIEEVRVNADLGADALLRNDVLDALGHAAYDTERHTIARRTAAESARQSAEAAGRSPLQPLAPDGFDALLRYLDDARSSVVRLRAEHTSRWSFGSDIGLRQEISRLKTVVDSLLAQQRFTRAERLCRAWLDEHGIASEPLVALGSMFQRPNPAGAGGASAKHLFEEQLRQKIDGWIARCGSARDCLAISDVVHRWAESMASRADTASGWKDALHEFLHAYALYWIADRLRSAAGRLTDDLEWPLVSARPTRYFVRVCLKIARILSADSAVGSSARICAQEFFEYARSRLDVYTRHLFRLPRERLAMLLLLASAARVWAEIERPEPEELLTSLRYLQQAEALVFELGLPRTLAWRFYFERVKTLRRYVEWTNKPAPGMRWMLDRDLQVLERLARGNRFWSNLAIRQRERTPPPASGFGDLLVAQLVVMPAESTPLTPPATAPEPRPAASPPG